MATLKNKIVLITGASAGIGEATAEKFAAAGANVIITARRLERLEKLAKHLHTTYKVDVLPLELDVQDYAAVDETINNLPKEWQAIDILVNNAGLGLALDKIQDADPKNWDTMIDTNVKGLLYVTRTILPGMIKRKTGHIINLGSVAGRHVYPGGNVYCATKYAVRAISASLRLDLLDTPIRVTEIAPGAVNTEFSLVRYDQDQARADKVYEGFEPLVAEDIAETIVFCATRPAHVNISALEIYPQAQAGVGYLNKTTQQ